MPNRQEDNGQSIIVGKFVQIAEDIKQRFGHSFNDRPAPINKPSKINRIFQADLKRFQRVKLFGAGIQTKRPGLKPRSRWILDAGGDHAFGFRFGKDSTWGILRNKHTDKIFVL